MTDRRAGSESRSVAVTRRGFVALAGSAALAGCNAFGGDDGEDGPTIDPEAYADALSTDPPSVAETLPVDIEQSYLDESAADSRESLSAVPAPLDREAVPNGAIRAELSRRYEDATEELEGAPDADSAFETMDRLRDARESARGVAGAWAAIDEGLTADDVLAGVPDVRDGVDEFRRRWRYVGDDSVRAVLVHAEVESLVALAVRRLRGAGERSAHRPENPFTVGDLAGRIADARVALDDAEYLYGRFAGSLDDSRRIRGGFESAVEQLVATLDDRRESLPDGDPDDASSFVDRDVEGTPVASALTDLTRAFEYADGLDDERATGRLASAVRSVHETLVRIRAFELLCDRVADGDHVTVETADDVRTIRERAFEAVASGVESDPLSGTLLSEIGGDFAYAEERLAGNASDDGISASWLDRDLGVYVLIGAMARATPGVSEKVVNVVRRTV
ncbi:hypothetical protein [Halorussus halobius]|uniref:hypothetical protein n=1 Tax=Halorussus halobius TaxID=1710537 RepID=UPI001092A45C|nr:hypothetical protein [Halorussus halobius]